MNIKEQKIIKKIKMVKSQKTLKTIISVLAVVMIIVVLANNVYAYQKLCLTKGQVIPSEEVQRYKCKFDLCEVCTTDNLYPTAPGYCGGIAGCTPLGGGPGIDVTPPVLTINSPVNDALYNSRKVSFNLGANEISDLFYIDNVNGRGRWSRLASNVNSYNKELSFKDGLNNITIRAEDQEGNYVDIVKVFRVDSQKPKLKKGEIDNQGGFTISFTELNPKTLKFHYGNNQSGFGSFEFNLQTECTPGKSAGMMDCSKTMSYNDYISLLSPYNGETIEYWFEIEDLAGNVAVTKKKKMDVDTVAPVINSINYTINGKNVEFLIDITEVNFDEVSYIDLLDSRARWKKACSRLTNGVCKKRISFKQGNHQVSIQASDEFGNSVAQSVNFVIA